MLGEGITQTTRAWTQGEGMDGSILALSTIDVAQMGEARAWMDHSPP